MKVKDQALLAEKLEVFVKNKLELIEKKKKENKNLKGDVNNVKRMKGGQKSVKKNEKHVNTEKERLIG